MAGENSNASLLMMILVHPLADADVPEALASAYAGLRAAWDALSEQERVTIRYTVCQRNFPELFPAEPTVAVETILTARAAESRLGAHKVDAKKPANAATTPVEMEAGNE